MDKKYDGHTDKQIARAILIDALDHATSNVSPKH